VVSQGRQPLAIYPRNLLSPGGATVTVAPPGLFISRLERFQGLAPLAKYRRPSGAETGQPRESIDGPVSSRATSGRLYCHPSGDAVSAAGSYNLV
jgi:hypothetical protein